MVTSHYPIHDPSMAENEHCSAAAWESPEGEVANPEAAYRCTALPEPWCFASAGVPDSECPGWRSTCAENGEVDNCRTVGDVRRAAAAGLEPLFEKFGVDIYNAGHAHHCKSLSRVVALRFVAIPMATC